MVNSCGVGGTTVSGSQAAVPTVDKASQCTTSESRGEATQTKLTYITSVGCQTDSTLPKAKVKTLNVFCPLCCKFFFQEGGLLRHWVLHHALELPGAHRWPYYCPQCAFASPAREVVVAHEMIHEAEKARARQIAAQRCAQMILEAESTEERDPSVCICCKEPTSREKCERYCADCPPCSCRLCPQHRLQVTKNGFKVRRRPPASEKPRPYVCEVCSKGYYHREDLFTHAVIHSGGKPFTCDVCHKGFSRKRLLAAHKKLYADRELFECSLCQRRFHHKHAFTNHSAEHSSEKRFKCEVCEKHFSRKANWIAHAEVHSAERRRFACELCPRSYSHQGHLDTHRRTHTGDGLFECTVCQKRFSRKRSLNVHSTIHSKSTPVE